MGTYLVPTRGKTEIEVVGERHHIGNIEKLGLIQHKSFENGQAIKTTFDIVPEPDNPYSRTGMSLSVRKNGLLLGYLPTETSRDIAKAVARITASGHVATVEGSLWTLKARDGLKAAIRVFVSSKLSDVTLKDQDGLTLVPVAESYDVPNAYQARPGDAKVMAKREPVTTAQALKVFMLVLKIFAVMVVAVVAQGITGTGAAAGFVFIVGAVWIIFGRRIREALNRRK